MATTNNAPMPTPTGPAEVFDDTIGPAQPVLSRDSLPAPPPIEAIAHVGQVNNIDPFLRNHYMILTTVTWSTHQAPGTKLFQMAIHPTEAHRWLAHLNKMYNTWSGSFDIGVKLAGTGFHAGGLLLGFVPPNIDPSTVNTPQDMSAFEYKIMDPKTLEVEMQTIRDERNVMFHWNPLDIKDRQSFGGWFILMVSIPLNTSATGATQIAIQIYTKPNPKFCFHQLIPIGLSPSAQTDFSDITKALSFDRGDRHDPVQSRKIGSIQTWSKKTKLYLDKETFNCSKLNAEPMNGVFANTTDPNAIQLKKWVTDGFTVTESEGLYKLGLTTTARVDLKVRVPGEKLPGPVGRATVRLVTAFAKQSGLDEIAFYEIFLTGEFKIEGDTNWFYVDHVYNENPPKWTGNYTWRQSDNVWPPGVGEFSTVLGDSVIGFYLEGAQLATTGDLIKYAPPIPENLVTFAIQGDIVGQGDFAQTLELASEFRYGHYANQIAPQQALLFQLIDDEVDLPIMIFKLHYDGYFTVPSSDLDVTYNVLNNKYSFRFIGKINENDPIVMSPSIAKNFLLSRINSTSPPRVIKQK